MTGSAEQESSGPCHRQSGPAGKRPWGPSRRRAPYSRGLSNGSSQAVPPGGVVCRGNDDGGHRGCCRAGGIGARRFRGRDGAVQSAVSRQHRRRPGVAVPRAAGWRGRRGLPRPADRPRWDRPVHLDGEQRDPARRHQSQRRRDPGRHPDSGRHLQLHGQRDRCERPERHRSRQRHRDRQGGDDIRRTIGGDRHGLHRHPDRRRGYGSLYLVGEVGHPAARDHPHLRGRAGGHSYHCGQLPVHRQRDRPEQRHRHQGDHPGDRRRSGAVLRGPTVRGDPQQLLRHAGRQRRHRPLHLVSQQREPAGRDHARPRDRNTGRDPDRRRHLHLHRGSNRRRRAVRHRGNHADHHLRSRAELPRPARRGDRHRLQ